VKRAAITIILTAALTGPACTSDKGEGPLEGVSAIVFLQREARLGGLGDIFQYRSYVPGARLMKLSPPTADGTLTVLCCETQGAEFEGLDIIDYDISYDARSIVFSARLSGDQRYGLFVLHLDSGEVDQLPTDPNRDYVYPTILPGGRVLYATNAVVEEGAPQFLDEYNRGVTLQFGSINLDGADDRLYSRNLSHRITSSVASDGSVIFTQWDHMGGDNAGRLLRMNPDGTRVREVFGKEGTGVTNSYYKAIEVAPGRVIAIGSSREMTFQSGTILDIRLGQPYEVGDEVWADDRMSEANASYRLLTPGVPRGDDPSFPTVGRYYNAYPLNARQYPDLLVSWADGPVQSDVNGAAGIAPDFGIYLYDSARQIRRPIYDNPGTWEINPRPLVARTAPPVIPAAGGHQFGDEAVLLGSMDVYQSTRMNFEPESIYGVRVIEGFSSEEGIPRDFGLTMHEGAAVLGVAEVRDDGSWAALIPANIPVHQQAIDVYGVALLNEPIWISGNPGESMFCGGCHEDRAATTVIQPGITEALAIGPTDLKSTITRFDRASTTFSRDQAVGVPWDVALQPIFDANCVSCHDGTPGPANPSYQICDTSTGQCQTLTFDLRGVETAYGFGDAMISGYTASHLSLLGPDMMELEENGFEIVGDLRVYVRPQNARGSELIQRLNPMRQFPSQNAGDRLFSTTPHLVEQGQADLTPDEMYLLVLMADLGGQFYSRENAPGVIGY
jgi:hypothetical protein